MRFKLNNHTWEIIELNNDIFHETRRKDGIMQNEKLNDTFFSYGYTNPLNQKIYLNSIQCEEQLKFTLMHELCHCWLWTMGSSYESYTEDALCDTVAASYNFIHKIIDKYFENKI